MPLISPKAVDETEKEKGDFTIMNNKLGYPAIWISNNYAGFNNKISPKTNQITPQNGKYNNLHDARLNKANHKLGMRGCHC